MRPLRGLVLAGGESSRMKTDKGTIMVAGFSLRERAREVLKPFCEKVYLSLRVEESGVEDVLIDAPDEKGPSAALLGAYRNDRECDWLVLACDFPFATPAALRELLRSRDQGDVVCFSSVDNEDEGREIPQPLFAIWTPRALAALADNVGFGKTGPAATLRDVDTVLLKPTNQRWLLNTNDPETLAVVIATLEGVQGVR